jgi:hypothetical protein
MGAKRCFALAAGTKTGKKTRGRRKRPFAGQAIFAGSGLALCGGVSFSVCFSRFYTLTKL